MTSHNPNYLPEAQLQIPSRLGMELRPVNLEGDTDIQPMTVFFKVLLSYVSPIVFLISIHFFKRD